MTMTATLGTIHAPQLRRVRRQDVVKQAYVKPDGLETCLACWKDWMASDSDRDLGVKTMRGLVGDEMSESPNIYEAQQQEDNRIGAATDAMINSLVRIQVSAIYRACGIATAWRFPNADILAVAAEAKEELTKKLKNNVCTARLF